MTNIIMITQLVVILKKLTLFDQIWKINRYEHGQTFVVQFFWQVMII
jgi:hypothetical protein